MPSSFPGSPALLKGALVMLPDATTRRPASVIVFQYNPAEMSRTVSSRERDPSGSGSQPRQQEVQRSEGYPSETLSLRVQLDAADQLEDPLLNPEAAKLGLHPALAALEMLLYPTREQVRRTRMQSRAGRAQVAVPDLPLTLLVWGPARTVPVRVTSFQVQESAYAPNLSPTRAEVQLGLAVLSPFELGAHPEGKGIFDVYHAQKEALARLHLDTQAQSAPGRRPA